MKRLKRQKPHGKSDLGSAFEAELDCKTMISYRMGETQIGAILNAAKPEFKSDQAFELVFAVEVTPVHAGEPQLEQIAQSWANGFKSMPIRGHFTLETATMSDDTAIQRQLREQEINCPSINLKFTALNQQKLTRELAQQGRRQERVSRIDITVPVPKAREAKRQVEDPLGRFLLLCQQGSALLWLQLKRGSQCIAGTQGQLENRAFHQRLLNAYDALEDWLRFLRNRMELSIRPLDENELYESLGQRFLRSQLGPPPQVVTVTPTTINEIVRSRHSLATHLTRNILPQGASAFIKLGDCYCGLVSLVEKPSGWNSRTAQILYLYEIQQSEGYRDTICLTQISKANQRINSVELSTLRKQAMFSLGHSLEKGDSSVGSELRISEADDAELKLRGGEQIVRVATVFLVYRRSLAELKVACEQLASRFAQPALAVRETRAARYLWLQSLPMTQSQLQNFSSSGLGLFFHNDFDRRAKYFTSEAVGFLPLLADVSEDQGGIELLSESWTPYHLNPIDNPSHTFIGGSTRSGKSLLACGRMIYSLSRGIPVVLVDYSFTFVDFAQFLGAPVYDLMKESINLFEIPDTRQMTPERQKVVLGSWKKLVLQTLMIMVIGKQPETAAAKATQSLLEIALNRYCQDEQILARFHQAHDQGIESPAWATMPTITDFIDFCQSQYFQTLGEQAKQSCDNIQLALTGWMAKPGIGEAISHPSSFAANDHFTLFLLTGLGDDDGAAVMAALSQMAANRVLSQFDACHFVMDEASIFMSYYWLNQMIGNLFAEGAKRGIRNDLIAQDPDTTYLSPNGPKIFQNINTMLIGRTPANALKSYSNYLGIPPEVIAENAKTSFFPNPNDCYSNWLVVQSSRYTRCRWFASPFVLAIAANNPPEREARSRVMERYSNKYEGITAFAEVIMTSIRQGRSVSEVATEHLRSLE